MASWTFSRLENGLVRLASDAGHVLDVHPVALGQMFASELLDLLERRAAEAPPAQPASAAPAAPAQAPEQAPEQPVVEEPSDGGQAQ